MEQTMSQIFGRINEVASFHAILLDEMAKRFSVTEVTTVYAYMLHLVQHKTGASTQEMRQLVAEMLDLLEEICLTCSNVNE